MLVIKSKNFVTSSHLVYGLGQYSWSSTIEDDCVTADDGIRSLSEMCKIFGNTCEPLIPENYMESSKILGVSPPWSLYIGNQKFQDLVNKQIGFYDELTNVHDGRLISIHAKINYFIDSLKPAVYNLDLVDSNLEKHINSHIRPHLWDGQLSKPMYLRTKTKTGRLSVIGGPNVLTMHSGLRKGLEDGYSIDFVSIEPNVLLVSQGREPRTDIYDVLQRDIFDNKISRAKVKIATMAALYGSGRGDKFAKMIEDYFKVSEKIKELECLTENDCIRNMFGRLVNLNGATGKHLLALWLQSSAADAALYGFYNFSKLVDIVPHWIIHDGLIFIYKQNKTPVDALDVGLQFKLPVKVEKL
tara:strand:- start:1304 stop:2374 length:1071 start_codon:yes stop_codon:yes gene_type:complete